MSLEEYFESDFARQRGWVEVAGVLYVEVDCPWPLASVSRKSMYQRLWLRVSEGNIDRGVGVIVTEPAPGIRPVVHRGDLVSFAGGRPARAPGVWVRSVFVERLLQ